MKTVKALIKAQRIGVSLTWLEKSNHELGDSVALALRKIYASKKLFREANARLFLPVIRESFRFTGMIRETEFKTPVRTIELLKDLADNIESIDLKFEIAELIEYLNTLRTMTD